MHGAAQPLDEARVVRAEEPVRGRLRIGRAEDLAPEALRRLHGPERTARGRRDDDARRVDDLDGVLLRHGRDRAAMRARRLDDRFDDRGTDEGPRRIVDEHDLRRL